MSIVEDKKTKKDSKGSPFEELTNVKDITSEQILAQLMEDKKKQFHTEIHNPFAISTLDSMCDYFEDIGLKEELGDWLGNMRTNMVAFNRKRANEIVDAYKYKKMLEEKKKMEQQLIGT